MTLECLKEMLRKWLHIYKHPDPLVGRAAVRPVDRGSIMGERPMAVSGTEASVASQTSQVKKRPVCIALLAGILLVPSLCCA